LLKGSLKACPPIDANGPFVKALGKDRYKVFSQAYLYDIMEGEAVDGLTEDNLQDI
jgi:hypothetical protein